MRRGGGRGATEHGQAQVGGPRRSKVNEESREKCVVPRDFVGFLGIYSRNAKFYSVNRLRLTLKRY
jgi:hypothetical protein